MTKILKDEAPVTGLSLSLSTGREGRDSIQAAPLVRTRTPAVLGGTTPSPQCIFH